MRSLNSSLKTSLDKNLYLKYGKYVDLLKAEPLHNTNNAWQSWFLTALAIVMHYTHQNHLKAATAVSDLPDSFPMLTLLKCLKDTLKCGRQRLSAVVQ